MKFLVTADWHFSKTIPICRKDNFFDIQKQTLQKIAEIAIKNNACIIIAGDIFDYSKPADSQELENLLFEIFRNIPVYFITGNHDLLNHSMTNFGKCSIGVLNNYENWHHTNSTKFDDIKINFFDYNQEIEDETEDCFKIAILHKYCDLTIPKYMKDGITANELLSNYNYDIIITGDNHTGFIETLNDKILFNPGCITRRHVDKKNYEPFVIIFDTDTKKYKKILLPDNDPNDVDDSYLIEEKSKEDRITSFVEKLKNQSKFNLDFMDNIDLYLKENNIPEGINKMVYKIIRGE